MPIYYLTEVSLQKSTMAGLVLCSGSQRLKPRRHVAAFSLEPSSSSQLIPVPGRIQFFVVGGLKTLFPYWLSLRVDLSSLQCLSCPLHFKAINAHYIIMPHKVL